MLSNHLTTYKVKNKQVRIYELCFKTAKIYRIDVLAHDGRHLTSYHIKSLQGAKSFTAVMRICKDRNNHISDDEYRQLEQAPKTLCPQSVPCPKQDGGNLPQLPASSLSTAGGNLLFKITIKNHQIKFLNRGDFVLGVIDAYGQNYTYHLPFDAYYRIRRINDDCMSLYGYPIGAKRFIKLCRKLSFDTENKRCQVA